MNDKIIKLSRKLIIGRGKLRNSVNLSNNLKCSKLSRAASIILRVYPKNIKFNFDLKFIVRVEHFILRMSCHNARVIYSHAVGS